MQRIPTRDLKSAYRKGVARLRTETDPLRRRLLLQFTYALKVDMAKRIKFKGRKKPLWKRIVQNVNVIKRLNAQPPDGGTNKIEKMGD